MQTEEFIERVSNETLFTVRLSQINEEVISVLTNEGSVFLEINVDTGTITFVNETTIDMDTYNQRALLDLLSEYSLTADKNIPFQHNEVTISDSEYQDLKFKEKKLKELESVLTGRSKVYTLPF